MIDLGQNCKIMTDKLEPQALEQVKSFQSSPAFEGSKIRVMPDVHAGSGCVIGMTCTTTGKVVPNVIGVDIGCGVRSDCIGVVDNIDFSAFDAHVRERVPSGFNVHDKQRGEVPGGVETVASFTGQDVDRVLRSIGTLGGGNHFIELGRDQLGRVWITVHTGSRNFGLKVAAFHQKRALYDKGNCNGLEWLEGYAAEEYNAHARVAQEFARKNRVIIMAQLRDFFSSGSCETVESVHNYIDHEGGVIRKGAISAKAGERVVIPWNMRDGLIIGRGKGNDDWNHSAPHGAGRAMGRKQAKKTLSADAFAKEMAGIWSSCVGEDTIDESPMAYKPASEILEQLGDTVEVELMVKPVYNFKASG